MDSPRQITDILTVTQAPVLALEDRPSKSFGHEETFGSEAETADSARDQQGLVS